MGENQTAVSINKPYFSKLKDIASHHPELRRVSGAVNYARAIEHCIDLKHTLLECKMHPVVIFVCDDCKKKKQIKTIIKMIGGEYVSDHEAANTN